MNILIVSFYFTPDLSAGSFRAAALVKALRELLPAGSTIDVITTLPNRYSSYQSEAPAEEERDGVRVHRISLPSHQSGIVDQAKAFLSFYVKAFRLARGRQYDLLFSTSSRLMTGFLGARLAARMRIPLYLDIRDIFVDTISDVFGGAAVKFAVPCFSRIEKYVVGQASRINLVSRGFEGYFRERYPGKPYDFFTNGIDDEFVGGKLIPAEQASGADGSRDVTVLYAGNIGEGQGLHNILPELAAKAGNRFKFVVVGDGGRRARLENELEQAGVSNVEFRQPVSRDALIALYRDADILFLHLNDHAAFRKVLPSKIFEYAATGKPILAGVSGFAENFLENEVESAHVFPPCDAQMAAEVLPRIELVSVDRGDFVDRYRRTNVMSSMARSVLSVTS